MKEKFSSSPLVELVAEVRWDTGNSSKNPIFPGESQVSQEVFFNNLKNNLQKNGYTSSERLIPHGVPMPLDHPIVRFKKNLSQGQQDSDAEQSSLYQVGVGLFTTNAVQPYNSWDEFKDIVQFGLESLISCNPEKISDGYSISLKYLDLFNDVHKQGMDNREFITKVLGFKFDFPDVLEGFSNKDNFIIPRFQLVIPLDFGMYQIQIVEAEINGEKGIAVEHTIANSSSFNDVNSMMQGFIQARDIIHKTFVETTKPIHRVMGLIEG